MKMANSKWQIANRNMAAKNLEQIVNLCKRRGFIFPGSEIYGGLGSFWDYGPLGVLLKNNVKAEWWKTNVQKRSDVIGLDSAILMNSKVWEASGHVSSFFDKLVECKKCHERYRLDQLEGQKLVCPKDGGELTEPKQFNLMFETYVGPVKDEKNKVYLRPETAQGIFVNFKNVLNSTRIKLPFGIAQIGKAFRNEITPGNFTFRTREFEQMEIEYFCHPNEAKEVYAQWIAEREAWYISLGIKKGNLRLRPHGKDELAHYAVAATDVEYNFPFGGNAERSNQNVEGSWSELEGIANRTDYDLKQHQKFSGEDLSYFDEETKAKLIPFVIEPSAGADRATLAFLVDAYEEYPGGRKSVDGKQTTVQKSEIGNQKSDKKDVIPDLVGNPETEIVLHLNPKLAPIKVAVLPLVKKGGLSEKALAIYGELVDEFSATYDEAASIGRRYRRQDEIGTPWCVTVDFDTLNDNKVTVRDRDTMKQERVKIVELVNFFKDKLK